MRSSGLVVVVVAALVITANRGRTSGIRPTNRGRHSNRGRPRFEITLFSASLSHD